MTSPGNGHVWQPHPLIALVMGGLVGRSVGRMGTCSRALKRCRIVGCPLISDRVCAFIDTFTFHVVNENVESCPFGWAIDIH